MAFVDEVTISAAAGAGGDGVVRWTRTKSKARGGPSGGDGGRGGDVLIRGVRDLAALSRYRFEKVFHAAKGEAGKGDLKHGADGAPLILEVPVGTLVRVPQTGIEHEVLGEDEKIILFKGGAGGKGNAHFKSSTHQNPFESTSGKPGKAGDVEFTLKIIADVGLIGLPNAGKSSLLSALTHARPKIGTYPFTTLEPHLGALYGCIIADIPGLIKGASEGRGLGIKFLKHIERTGVLFHLVSAVQEDPLSAYREVRKELEAFGHNLLHKKEIIILSQTDLVSPQESAIKQQLLVHETGRDVVTVSIHESESLKKLSDTIVRLVRKKHA